MTLSLFSILVKGNNNYKLGKGNNILKKLVKGNNY